MMCFICRDTVDPKTVSRFDAELVDTCNQVNAWHLYACYLCADKLRGAINNVLADQATTNAYEAAAEEMFPGC